MLEGGPDIRYVQQLLGHASLETTQVCTALTIQQLREVQALPSARRKNAPASPTMPPSLPPAPNAPSLPA